MHRISNGIIIPEWNGNKIIVKIYANIDYDVDDNVDHGIMILIIDRFQLNTCIALRLIGMNELRKFELQKKTILTQKQ